MPKVEQHIFSHTTARHWAAPNVDRLRWDPLALTHKCGPLQLRCGPVQNVEPPFSVGLHVDRSNRLGQISNNVPRKSPVGIFEEKGANHFF